MTTSPQCNRSFHVFFRVIFHKILSKCIVVLFQHIILVKLILKTINVVQDGDYVTQLTVAPPANNLPNDVIDHRPHDLRDRSSPRDVRDQQERSSPRDARDRSSPRDARDQQQRSSPHDQRSSPRDQRSSPRDVRDQLQRPVSRDQRSQSAEFLDKKWVRENKRVSGHNYVLRNAQRYFPFFSIFNCMQG